MITVLVAPNEIHVSDHANTAPLGSDIVCSVVSALTLTLIEGLKNIAQIGVCENAEPGNICIKLQEINDIGKALIDTWFLGLCGIAAQYPVIEFL